MKKIKIILLGISITFGLCAFAQNNETITVKKSDLPADLVQKLDQQKKLQDIKQNLDTIKVITSVGKEIGIAINDGLSAITEQTSKFAKTTPGKFTMFLIAWKVMAKDAREITSAILGVAFGVPFLIFFEFLLISLFRRVTTKRRVLLSENGKSKNYEYQDTWYTKDNKDSSDAKLAFVICWWIIFAAGNIWIIAGIIF